MHYQLALPVLLIVGAFGNCFRARSEREIFARLRVRKCARSVLAQQTHPSGNRQGPKCRFTRVPNGITVRSPSRFVRGIQAVPTRANPAGQTDRSRAGYPQGGHPVLPYGSRPLFPNGTLPRCLLVSHLRFSPMESCQLKYIYTIHV